MNTIVEGREYSALRGEWGWEEGRTTAKLVLVLCQIQHCSLGSRYTGSCRMLSINKATSGRNSGSIRQSVGQEPWRPQQQQQQRGDNEEEPHTRNKVKGPGYFSKSRCLSVVQARIRVRKAKFKKPSSLSPQAYRNKRPSSVKRFVHNLPR